MLLSLKDNQFEISFINYFILYRTSVILMVSCKSSELHVSMALVFLYSISEAIKIFRTNFLHNCSVLSIPQYVVLATISPQP